MPASPLLALLGPPIGDDLILPHAARPRADRRSWGTPGTVGRPPLALAPAASQPVPALLSSCAKSRYTKRISSALPLLAPPGGPDLGARLPRAVPSFAAAAAESHQEER